MGNSAITSGIITPRLSYQRTFINADLATGVLTVTHNLNSNYVIVVDYDNTSKQIGPDDVTLTSVNALTIDLTSFGTLTGTWSCIVIEQGATTSVVPTTIQDSTGNNQIVASASNIITMKTNSVTQLIIDSSGYIKSTMGLIVDRGDPAARDKTQADLTLNDSAWHDLDLSAIVPAGAKSILLYVSVADASVNRLLKFRKNGNSNEYTTFNVATVLANDWNYAQGWVFCDVNRVIEYKADSTISDVAITIMGWSY